MTRRRKDPLRALKADEREWLERLSRSQAEPAMQVARAKMLLAVADGSTYREAARLAGRKSDVAVSQLVSRFNAEGLEAVVPRHGGGPEVIYGAAERERILREARRAPELATDGVSQWSLTTLQQALRRAPDGLPQVSTYTIWVTLREAGFRFLADRSWCETGKTKRKRKAGVVEVTDPQAMVKKN